jgi:glycine cleavage system T protein (aminomethyltransferase)
VKVTPFHDRTHRSNRKQMWFNWDRHIVPDAYNDFATELRATRVAVTMGDMSPLSKYEIGGPDALRFVDRLVTRDATQIDVGQTFYSPWTDDRGKVVGDGLVFRVSDHEFRVTADPQLEWFTTQAEGLDIGIEDISDAFGLLAIQGPRSREVMDALTGESWADLSFSRIRTTSVAGAELLVARQGFTGELGFELWVPEEGGGLVWDEVASAGEPFDITPAGEHAIDVARVEAGLLIVGADYTGAGIDRPGSVIDLSPEHEASPYELGMDAFVDLDAEAFVGRDALWAELASGGPRRRLTGLEIDRDSVLALYAADGEVPSIPDRVWWYPLDLTHDGRHVGWASSVTWAPTVPALVGFGHVDADLAGPGTELAVRWTLHGGDDPVPARVVELPFLELRRSL